MEKINQFGAISKGTPDVDWNRVENFLGFRLHENLKDFYSRMLCKSIRGLVDFSEEKFIKKPGIKEMISGFPLMNVKERQSTN